MARHYDWNMEHGTRTHLKNLRLGAVNVRSVDFLTTKQWCVFAVAVGSMQDGASRQHQSEKRQRLNNSSDEVGGDVMVEK